MMGRHQKLIDAVECDVVYARKWYRYLFNSSKIVSYTKRKMNKRWRAELKKEIHDIVIEVLREELFIEEER